MQRLRSFLANVAHNFRALLGSAPTRWARLVLLAWLCVIGYIIIITGAVFRGWKAVEHPVENTLNAVLAVALMILSIRYSGVLTDFYQRLTGFGITDIRVNRHGQDPTLTGVWMKRISQASQIDIVGTLSRGWFRHAGENLDSLLTQYHKVRIRVYLLDPFGTIWRGLIASGTARHTRFLDDATEVFRTLYELASAHPEQFSLHLYDTEPLSFVRASGTIYLGLYLPRISRTEVPECTISEGSPFGQKIIESADRLMKTAPLLTAPTIAAYRQIMQEHAVDTRHNFWADSRVTCDFCKELNELPSTFTRRHIDFRRVLNVGKYSCVLPSLGPLVPGHALLLPKQHVTSLARLDEETFAEMGQIADNWTQKVTTDGKTALIFEHGTPSDDNTHGGCGICHCHLHLLPLSQTEPAFIYSRLSAFLTRLGYSPVLVDLETWSAIRSHANDAYLAVRVGDGKLKVLPFGNDTVVQSQLLRRFVAEELLVPPVKWDWKDAEVTDDDAEKQQVTACFANLKQMLNC